MQTGQNSIAPKNSLPQLGQVRWGSALIGLTALQWRPQPKARQRSQEVRNRPARLLANYRQKSSMALGLRRPDEHGSTGRQAATNGMQKCFSPPMTSPYLPNPPSDSQAQAIINQLVIDQEGHFQANGFQPVTLFSQKLHAIDIRRGLAKDRVLAPGAQSGVA